jgi:hypothetical protein
VLRIFLREGDVASPLLRKEKRPAMGFTVGRLDSWLFALLRSSIRGHGVATHAHAHVSHGPGNVMGEKHDPQYPTKELDASIWPLPGSTFTAFGEDGGFKPLPEFIGQLINFMSAVDFNGLASRVERYDAVIAAAQVLFQLGPQRRRDLVVEQVVEFREKFCAGHLAPSLLLSRK